MELLVRIANDRYARNKICKNISKSIKKLVNECIFPSILTHKLNDISSYNSNAWREEVYSCEDVDLILRAYKVILECVYQKYSGRKTLPGCKKFMCLEEFVDLCRDSGLGNEKISPREMNYCFVQAMMTQVDEYYKKRHFEMNFVEFLEAFSRVSDIRDDDPNKSLAKSLEKSLQNLIKLCP